MSERAPGHGGREFGVLAGPANQQTDDLPKPGDLIGIFRKLEDTRRTGRIPECEPVVDNRRSRRLNRFG